MEIFINAKIPYFLKDFWKMVFFHFFQKKSQTDKNLWSKNSCVFLRDLHFIKLNVNLNLSLKKYVLLLHPNIKIYFSSTSKVLFKCCILLCNRKSGKRYILLASLMYILYINIYMERIDFMLHVKHKLVYNPSLVGGFRYVHFFLLWIKI